MSDETVLTPAEENRLRTLIEQMQRQGRTEREITEAMHAATRERVGSPRLGWWR